MFSLIYNVYTGETRHSANCNLANRNRRTPWLSLWESWLPRKGQTERASRRDFGCYYLTAVPSQSACSADSSPRGRAKGCYRICPLNYNLSHSQLNSIIPQISQPHKKNFFPAGQRCVILSFGDYMNRGNIEKIAKTAEDKLLLAKLWDKIDAGMRKNVAAATCFLSPRELELARYLFGQPEGLYEFGGYADAERKMLVYLPDYLDESELTGPDSPIVCLRASFFQADTPTHRDFLGALIGAGLGRESIGDICVGQGSCFLFVTAQVAPYLLSSFTGAGRTHVHLEAVSLADVQVSEPEVKEIKDTLASLRLDSVISSGFRIGRSLAAQYISVGKAAIDGLPCEKPDKQVTEGAKISVRGLGKIKLAKINGTTKKDRISVVLHRYV